MPLTFNPEVIENFLQEVNWTEADLARQMGVAKSTIHKITNGKMSPSGLIIAQLIRASKGRIKFEQLYNLDIAL